LFLQGLKGRVRSLVVRAERSETTWELATTAPKGRSNPSLTAIMNLYEKALV